MITVRRMEKRDAMQASVLEKENFSLPWSEASFLDSLSRDYAYYFVAEEEQTIIGICGMRMIAGEGEITNVSVAESSRTRGVASLLLTSVLQEGERHGAEAFTLEVRCGNEPAIRLYEKFGFQTEGIRKDFYDNPREDACIMWKR